MAALSIEALCAEIPVDFDCADLVALFPGGIELGPGPGTGVPVPQGCARELIGLLNTALAPLAPLFNVLDAVLCVIQVVKAVPDSLGPPPDPTKIVQKLAACAEKFEKLLDLVPAFSIPRMIKAIIAIAIAALRSLRAELLHLLDMRVRIDVAEARAHLLGERFPVARDQLLFGLTCARGTEAAMKYALQSNGKPLNRLLGIINVFLGLAGQDPISARLELGGDARAAVEPLDALIAILTTVRRAIP